MFSHEESWCQRSFHRGRSRCPASQEQQRQDGRLRSPIRLLLTSPQHLITNMSIPHIYPDAPLTFDEPTAQPSSRPDRRICPKSATLVVAVLVPFFASGRTKICIDALRCHFLVITHLYSLLYMLCLALASAPASSHSLTSPLTLARCWLESCILAGGM